MTEDQAIRNALRECLQLVADVQQVGPNQPNWLQWSALHTKAEAIYKDFAYLWRLL